MPRKVFFSFHYERDVWRVSQVRNSNVVSNGYTQTPFLDHADWEAIRRRGNTAIKNWIDDQMEGSTITCVLIGRETNSREWVHYEIRKSIERKNAILGIYIHNVKNSRGEADFLGTNPFNTYQVNSKNLSLIAPTFDWVNQNGYLNFGDWIEKAVGSFKEINWFRGA